MFEVITAMAKKGMKRPERTHTKEKNMSPAVPELQGKHKSGKESANPVVAGTDAPAQRVWHTKKTDQYDVFDSDLARENLENDTPAADL